MKNLKNKQYDMISMIPAALCFVRLLAVRSCNIKIPIEHLQSMMGCWGCVHIYSLVPCISNVYLPCFSNIF